MKKYVAAITLLCLFPIVSLRAFGYPWQDPVSKIEAARQADSISQEAEVKKDPRLATGAMSAEEKQVRNAYIKLMRYHTASNDEKASTSGASVGVDGYVVFELRDIQRGWIEEIYESPFSEFVTPAIGEIVKVKAHRLRHAEGPSMPTMI